MRTYIMTSHAYVCMCLQVACTHSRMYTSKAKYGIQLYMSIVMMDVSWYVVHTCSIKDYDAPLNFA